jgi:hypothetical protein
MRLYYGSIIHTLSAIKKAAVSAVEACPLSQKIRTPPETTFKTWDYFANTFRL